MYSLVTIVVPAYNAEATLADTLESISRQTYPNIETIIVDDGSKDRTRTIAEAFVAGHANARVISTPNGGVAAARNVGIHAATGVYIAPIDADDLWHPEKTARQCAILDADPDVTLVYANRRHIDSNGQVLNSMPPATLEGFAYARHAAFNVVGNGSAIMFRRQDAELLGGYDERLRAWGGQGCEDYLLQVRLARRGKIRVTPGFLVGYRQLDNAMSRDSLQMLWSRVLALRVLAEEEEQLPGVIRSIQSVFEFRLVYALIKAKRWREATTMLGEALRGASPSVATELVDRVTHRVWRGMADALQRAGTDREGVGRHFYDYAVDADADNTYPPMVLRLMRRYLPYDIKLEAMRNARTGTSRDDADKAALHPD